MSDEKQPTKADVYKAIGQLEESTNTMKQEIENSNENEERIVSFFTLVGRIIKGILMR